MFKFRSGGQGASSPAQPLTTETVRRRARHRLIGATVLVLAGVIGFPLLFDSQPRPIPVDIPIEIPAKSGIKPLTLPAQAATASAAKIEGLDAQEQLISPSVAVKNPAVKPAVESKPEAKTETKPAKPTKPPEAKPGVTKSDKPADKPTDKSETNLRIVVQVGAFAEPDRAREARMKLERAGMKTYIHEADTPEGKRIRVRVGPYPTKAEADKAATKVKSLGLPAAILTL